MDRENLKAILLELVWGFSKPKSQFQSRLRAANRTLAGIAVLWLILIINPQFAFSHSLTYQNYTIHSIHPIPDEAKAVLERADHLLQESDIFTRDNHHHIFLCNSPGRFRLFNLRSGQQVYGYSHLTSNIFITNGDPAADLVWKTANTNIVRSLSGVIAHEVTHNLVRDKIGVIGQWRLPTWKSEGYSEYISIHGQKDYEVSLAQGLPAKVQPNSISPDYQAYLKRTLTAFADGPVSFESLQSSD